MIVITYLFLGSNRILGVGITIKLDPIWIVMEISKQVLAGWVLATILNYGNQT